MMVAEIVSQKIAARREDLGQSQADLARAMCLVRPTINRVECQAVDIGVERLCQFALALGVEPASLLPKLEDLAGLTGLGCIATLEPIERPTGEAYVEAVLAGARRYTAEHNQRPRTDGGDASQYVGFDTTWCAIHNALLRGSNGAPKVGGIHGLLDKHNFPGRRRGR